MAINANQKRITRQANHLRVGRISLLLRKQGHNKSTADRRARIIDDIRKASKVVIAADTQPQKWFRLKAATPETPKKTWVQKFLGKILRRDRGAA